MYSIYQMINIDKTVVNIISSYYSDESYKPFNGEKNENSDDCLLITLDDKLYQQ